MSSVALRVDVGPLLEQHKGMVTAQNSDDYYKCLL
jgi:hypothetical protein